jgi:hypothetical protein
MMENKKRLKTSSFTKQGLKPSYTTALIALLILVAFSVKSQDSQLRPSRIYGTFGTAFIYTNITANIEQEISNNSAHYFNSVSLRIGAGHWSSWGNESYNIIGTINWLSGTNNHHLELGTGIAYSPAYDDSFGFLPAAQIGYRYQKPDGILLFRTGIGVPEALYVSLGVCF